MAEKELRSIQFPGLEDRYVVPEGGGGATGPAGKDGITPTIGANGNWYLGDTDTQKPSRGEKGADGAAGKDGSDGYSPEATVTPINGGAKIIIKDKNGTTSANVMNGARGPKGDAGPQGPKGDPGATDFSLGITGAQVGQIAKITAVDASGKPTAWEPVDMAGGGGKPEWILLGDIALTEDTAVISITKTPDDQSFSVREISFFGKIFCDQVQKLLQFSASGTIAYGNPLLDLGSVLNAAEGKPESIAAYIKILPECMVSRTHHNQYNEYMGYSTPAFSASNLRNKQINAYSTIGDPITTFAVGSWASGVAGVFKAGTHLKFYGR